MGEEEILAYYGPRYLGEPPPPRWWRWGKAVLAALARIRRRRR